MEYQYPGFRFYPMEEELISFYLYNKLEGRRPDIDRVIPVVDIYDHHPSHLPQLAGEYCRGDPEQWFFFLPIQDREARGGRPNRLTSEGYWKATGSPGLVYSSQSRIIGVRKTMVFYKGRAPNGEKTPWKMNEYRAIDGQVSSSSPPKLRQELSLCRVYKGSKSVRAFDRRPTPTGAAGPVHEVDQETSGVREVNQPPMASHRHPKPSSLAEGASSSISSSSSSGEDGPRVNPPPEEAVGTHDHQSEVDMDFENKPMWDWEQLNWLY